MRVKLVLTVIAALLAIGSVALIWRIPAFGAYLCPGCVGLERAADHVYVDSTMTAPDRAELLNDLAIARAQVASFYGALLGHPQILVCSSGPCDRRLGGMGPRAVAYGGLFIHVSPHGRNATILSHELSHIEFAHRLGNWHALRETLPAWFEEGVAVIVSRDLRFLQQSDEGQLSCLQGRGEPLPDTKRKWGPKGGLDHMIYADAACRVLRWMEHDPARASGTTLVPLALADPTLTR